jgi:hypothetical protein
VIGIATHEINDSRRRIMRQTFTFATVKSALFAGLALLGTGMTGPLRADDQIDKKVVEIVKQTGDFYKNAKSFHVEGTFVSKVEGGDEKRDINVKAVYDIERPNRLSLKTELNGDSKKGPDVVADGKKLTVHGKGRKQYLEKDSPPSLAEIGIELLQLGPTMTGMLFGNVLADDPADLLMEGVNSCSYVGKDKVDGAPVHRMKFSQAGFDWELWVAAEGKPYILRMIRVGEGPNGKVTTTETYKNWKLDSTIAKETFTFSAPSGAKKVDDFEESQDK